VRSVGWIVTEVNNQSPPSTFYSVGGSESGGGSGSVGVTVSPAGPITLTQSQTQQFTATVTGTSNTAVNWSINPVVGTVSSGLYTAPGSIAGAQTVTVTATSVADGSKSASGTVSLTPAVQPDFTVITTGPNPVLFRPGFPAGRVVSVTPIGGFSGTVSLSVGGLPNGSSFSWNPYNSVLNGSGTVGITITQLPQNTPPGAYTVTIYGTYKGTPYISHSASFMLQVGGSPLFQYQRDA
jgi:hypothetical protein